MPQRIAIVVIATGPYQRFLTQCVSSARARLFAGEERRFHVFSDNAAIPGTDVTSYHIPHLPWPHNTLFRYHYMNHIRGELAAADVVVYLDVDMVVETDVRLSEVLTPETAYFGVQHPTHGPDEGTFETNPASTAWLDRSRWDTTNYWQACIWGGRADKVVGMVKILADRVHIDLRNGVVAEWHDESHLNRFFVENKPEVHTLDSGFAFQEGETYDYVLRIRHAFKPFDEFPCLPGPPATLIRTPPTPRVAPESEGVAPDAEAQQRPARRDGIR